MRSDWNSSTGAKHLERMREMLRKPSMTNLERAHLILAQDNPTMIAKEWAEDYVRRHDPDREPF